MSLGVGTLLAKIEFKSAYRLVPVHPGDRLLLVMERFKVQTFLLLCCRVPTMTLHALMNELALSVLVAVFSIGQHADRCHPFAQNL